MEEFAELKQLILYRIDKLEEDYKAISAQMTKMSLQVNTIVTKIWAAGLGIAFIASIVSSIIVTIILSKMK